jgi:hypothetical protein
MVVDDGVGRVGNAEEELLPSEARRIARTAQRAPG